MNKIKSFIFQWIEVLLGIGGAILLAWTIQKIGYSALKENLVHFGAMPALFLIVLYSLAQFCFTAAWLWVIEDPEKKLGFWKLFPSYLAGDALNMTIPSGNLAGEPVKILLIRDWIAVSSAIASVTIYKLADFFSMTLFLLIGWLVHFGFFSLPLAWQIGGGIVAGGMLAVCLLLYLLQARGFYHPASRWLEKIGLGHWIIGKLEAAQFIDETIQDYFQNQKSKFFVSTFFNFLAWFGGVLEIMVFQSLFGLPVSFASALTIETFSLFINNVTFFVPARLGVIEGGRILLFSALGYPTSAGLTYSIIRRIRELVWISGGLMILFIKKRTSPKMVPNLAN